MGRHSAPDDHEEDAVVPSPVATDRPRAARHAHRDEPAAQALAEELTAPLPAVPPDPFAVASDAEAAPLPAVPPDPIAVASDAEAAPLPAVPPDPPPGSADTAAPEADGSSASPGASTRPALSASKHVQSTAADLALLRERSDVRARVIAGVIVPFLLYTAVLVSMGALDVYPIWVWIPLVTAGVVAGSILDAAHRRRAPDQGDR